MIKYYTLTLFLLWILPSSYAQKEASWAIGFQLGEQFSTLWGESTTDYRPGFIVGLHASHYLTRNIVLRAEVNYERRGVLAPQSLVTDQDFAIEHRFNYLTLPVMIRYSTEGKIRWIGGGGVSVNFLLNERQLLRETFVDLGGDLQNVTTDLLLLGGASYPLNDQIRLSMDVRSILSISEMELPARGTQQRIGRHLAWGIFAGFNYYL
jgi:hypothetical protein